jgi:hypothetical protein
MNNVLIIRIRQTTFATLHAEVFSTLLLGQFLSLLPAANKGEKGSLLDLMLKGADDIQAAQESGFPQDWTPQSHGIGNQAPGIPETTRSETGIHNNIHNRLYN